MKKHLLFLLSLFSVASCMQGMEQNNQYLNPSESEWYAPCGPYLLGEYKPMILQAIENSKDFETGWDIAQHAKQLWPSVLHDKNMIDILIEKAKKEDRWDLPTAIEKGDIAIVFLLLLSGASINEKSGCWTALSLAALYGFTDITKLLLEHGAGASINIIGTALAIASREDHTDIVQLLLEHGAGALFNEKNNNGWTALALAAKNGSADIVKLLLEHGAGVAINETDVFGYTALMMAANKGSKETVILLLEYGAEPEIKDPKGRTALDLAQDEQIKELIEASGKNIKKRKIESCYKSGKPSKEEQD